MTYSRSATVLQALLDLGRRNPSLRVYCGEGRPNYEGQLLALDLGGAGVAVTLGIDMALFDWLPEVGALVVGADSVSHEGIVNKVGTRELMVAAAQREIPCIVLASTDKFLPNEYSVSQTLRGGDPDEVMGPAKNVTILNPYFGVTPPYLVSVLVTEQGPMPMHTVLEQLAALRIYPGLMGRREV
jgi:translation initiation factor eIF-2B subunit delta